MSETSASHSSVQPSASARVDLEGPLLEPILFDQYSRYASCAEHLDAAMSPGACVLDVGCGPFRLLGKFLPGVEVSYLDPLLPADEGEHVLSGSLDRLAQGERRWDWVVAVDTLEHVRPEQRAAFLETLCSLAREGVLLSAPYSEDRAAVDVDERVDAVYKLKTGTSYSWLEEHHEYGLPSLHATRAALEAQGFQCAVAGNGHAPWLEELLPLTVLHLARTEHVDTIQALSRRFNRELYAFDALEPVYRRVLVGKRGVQPKMAETCAQDEGMRVRADELWRDFRGACQVMLSTHADDLAARAEALQAKCATAKRDSDVLRSQAAELHAQAAELSTLLARHEASLSWRMTRPLRWAKSRLTPLKEVLSASGAGPLERSARAIYRALPIGKRGRYLAKRAFFALFGWCLQGTAAQRHHLAEERQRQERTAGRVAGGASVQLAPARSGRADVIVWGVIDWHFRIQRPQHLARELARAGHRVFYITPNIGSASVPHFSVQPLDEGQGLVMYHIELQAPHAPSIYAGVPGAHEHEALARAVRGLLHWMQPDEVWSIVNHPGWLKLAAMPPGQRLVYDWMDNHQGFSNTCESLISAEHQLLMQADLTLVSSELLRVKAEEYSRSVCMLRNAGEFEHFCHEPARVLDLARGQRVIGYYGAIAEWFDVELVRALARRHPDVLVLLVGADTSGAADALASESNVQFVGEVAYAELPRYLYAMDVCLIPFLINELTLATNPVKVYEYLAAGRPVVTTDLPEIRDADLDSVVARCADRGSFLQAVDEALDEPASDPARARRISRAKSETWGMRGETLCSSMAELEDPLVSVIVISWNNLHLTQACLESLFSDPAQPNLDVIVVDNGSQDGTAAWLRAEAEREPRLRLILNDDNRGFAAANNQGLDLARGEFLVLLNNDTVVTRGWLREMVAHFRRDPELGMLGPITNNIGNEAKVPTSYETREAMHAEAAQLVIDGAGKSLELGIVAFFCVMMTREVFEEVGLLDEGFGMGFFEDDDYCRRVRAAGKSIRCAEDVFIHHELSASFDKIDQAQRAELFERNKRYYESKWGEWQPHAYRGSAASTRAEEACCEASSGAQK